MLTRTLRALVIAAAVLMPASLFAQDKPIVASDAWIKLPADGETSTTAFAAINNPGMYDVYILSGTSDVAEKIELRRGTGAADDVTLTHYETTYLDPKGSYLQLTGLKRPLKEGEKIWLALKTDTNETINVEATVKKAP